MAGTGAGDLQQSSAPQKEKVRDIITGTAAHARIAPLLPKEWEDCTPCHADATRSSRNKGGDDVPIDFIWENAPRSYTNNLRDFVKCYSHLPNSIRILDNKWALARLQQSGESIRSNSRGQVCLESHCFRGASGFEEFAANLFASKLKSKDGDKDSSLISSTINVDQLFHQITSTLSFPKIFHETYYTTWVIKDAASNGAGGIWIMSKNNFTNFLPLSNDSPLIENHKYVAQKYAFPPLLWHGRKFHVRVYAVLTADGQAYIHRRAFLHVANEMFDARACNTETEDRVHITNCCANSDDVEKFAGEICIDFEDSADATSVIIASYFPSIQEAFRDVVSSAWPFVKGGEVNGGFEYMGLDFILSSTKDPAYASAECMKSNPVAYLLEINAPPSQDTATGLDHAEGLHNEVLSDLVKLWILPKADDNFQSELGGWRRVLDFHSTSTVAASSSLPSKRTFLNQMRWVTFEQKTARAHANEWNESMTRQLLTEFSRAQFPYFSNRETCRNIFLENAGGSQVPQQVESLMSLSLVNRHRSVVGARWQSDARDTMRIIMNASRESHQVFLGQNATSLLMDLALSFAGLYSSNDATLTNSDEIVVCMANHEANIKPWVLAAQISGAKIVWWTATDGGTYLDSLIQCLSPSTKVVALPHASNVLGYCHDLAEICEVVHKEANGRAHVVADGVSSSPHRRPDVQALGAHWYVLSCHKLFGPHVGVLSGSLGAVQDVFGDEDVRKIFEKGTINFEACAGIVGLGKYICELASHEIDLPGNKSTGDSDSILHEDSVLSDDTVEKAYRRIELCEKNFVSNILCWLASNPKVNILEEKIIPDNRQDGSICVNRLPIISFVHEALKSSVIVAHCKVHGVILRHGSFLSSRALKSCAIIEDDCDEGVVRVSLVHYNTFDDIQKLKCVLGSIVGW
eukprot:CAMPEP_0116003578 /NCGR_PEP_ID=MMETSP0321-20121206/130_1 /TAXON_ID=163516 /ORGANISM="Leptocylindrus danicus var. danicus, Strain B650" /LENGTH=918 /DNA_ID=CAMNT_0003471795 /DNA_START=19 /DNA_END=2776 /DNA_ORIENTATION=+